MLHSECLWSACRQMKGGHQEELEAQFTTRRLFGERERERELQDSKVRETEKYDHESRRTLN
jgi:hypothetical protein